MVLQKECRIFLKRIIDLAIVSIWSAQLIVLIKWWKTWISLFCVKVRTRRSKHGYSTREQLFLFTVQSWLGGLLHISMNKIYVYHSYTIATEYYFYHHIIWSIISASEVKRFTLSLNFYTFSIYWFSKSNFLFCSSHLCMLLFKSINGLCTLLLFYFVLCKFLCRNNLLRNG